MKIGLSEKQYKTILTYVSENQEVTEDEEVPSAEPEAGTSSTQSGGQGYPEVGKWESGVTRGPANQVGVTKWSDVVGSTLKRSKANQLKEQGEPNQEIKGDYSLWSGTPYKTYKTCWGDELKIPSDGTFDVVLWKNDDDRLKIFSSNPNYEKDGKWYLPSNGQETLKPSIAQINNIIPSETIRFIKDLNEKRTYTTRIILNTKYNLWDISPGYVSKDNKIYNWEDHIYRGFKQWWSDNWEMVLTIVASAVAGILTGGASIWVQAAAQAIAGVSTATFAYLITDEKDRDNIGYGINILLSFVPFTSAALKIGIKAPLAGLSKIAPKLNKAKTMDQVFNAIKELSEPEQILATRMIMQVPKEFNRQFKSLIMEGFVKGVRNGSIKLSKIPFKERMWWKQLGVETGIQFLIGGTLTYPDIKDWIEFKIREFTTTKEELSKIKNKEIEDQKKLDEVTVVWNKTVQVQSLMKNISEDVFNEKFDPILSNYEQLRVSTNIMEQLKFLEIYELMLNEYIKNPNTDLDLIVTKKYGKNEQ